MKKISISLFLFSGLLFANMKCKEYGHHYYSVTENLYTFSEAKTIAQNNGGYLAIPNSAEENSFIANLIGGNSYGWIGVEDITNNSDYGTINKTRFKDIFGNSLSYSNWDTFEPNNKIETYDVQDGKNMVSPIGEHWVIIFGNNGKWSDIGNHIANPKFTAYAVIEFDNASTCQTNTTDDTNSDVDFEIPKCNTKIYDSKLDISLAGSTFECLKDTYGTYYCPEGLADAGEEWEYDDGYSKKYTRIVTRQIKCPNGYEYSSTTELCEKVEVCY